MAQDREAEIERQNAWINANLGESYSQAFQIRKVMYRIQDIDLPFKRGIRVEQFLVFLLGIVISLILNTLIVSPILGILNIKLPMAFNLIRYLALPIFLAVRIGKPMPHNKSISGYVMSLLRYHLDDRVHARGMPIKKKPFTGLEANYMRTWSVDPAYARVEADNDKPAADFALYVNQDLPDDPIVVRDDREKERILESDEQFYDRLYARDLLGTTEQVEDVPDIAPSFDRESIRSGSTALMGTK